MDVYDGAPDMSHESDWSRAITGARKMLSGAFGRTKNIRGASTDFQDLTPKEKTRVVRDILKISDPDEKATLVASISKQLGETDRRSDISPLIDEAIKNFGSTGHSSEMGASAIVSARALLQSNHQSKIKKILRHKPERDQLIKDKINDLGALRGSQELLEEASRKPMSADKEARAAVLHSVRERDSRGR